MRVAFISRSSLFKVRGGDTTQMEQTAAHLRNLGVDVDILLSCDTIQYDVYDILHFFNLIRPADILYHQKRAKGPTVISPIYVDYSDFDLNERKGLPKAIAIGLGKFGSEYFKTIYRALRGQDKLKSKYYLLGHKRAMKKAVSSAAFLLPNSESETSRITKDLTISFEYHTIPNAIDTQTFKVLDDIERKPKQLICVGQIEGRKNQHRLIEATKDLDVDLLIVGRPSPNNVAYLDFCKSIAHNRVQFFDFVSQSELCKMYNASAVHILPSWFETTGLTSLEAAACGCKLVVSEAGDTRDYFDGGANFCKPFDVKSIQNAIAEALSSDHRDIMFERISREYNWNQAAKKTLAAYHKITP